MADKVASDVAHVKLAAWLYRTHPELFAALVEKAAAFKAANPPRIVTKKSGLAGITDFFSSIGDAVSSVGSYLTSSAGISTLSSLGTAYFTSQAQRSVLNTQLARAQVGQAPLPVAYTTQTAVNPQTGLEYAAQVPIQQGANGAYQYVTPTSLAAATPASFIGKYGLYLALGAGVIAIIFLTRR